MTPTVEEIIGAILRREGGYVNHPADKGGPTKHGITARTLADWCGLDRPVTAEEVQALDVDTARAIYRTRYVVPFDWLSDPLRSLVVDWAVTSGFDDPVKVLQTTLKRRGIYDGAIDGVAGPKTREAVVVDPDPRRTYREVFTARVEFYTRLALSDPQVRAFRKGHPDTDLENLAGWLARSLEFAL